MTTTVARRTQQAVIGREESHAFLEAAYGARLRVLPSERPLRVDHSRLDADDVVVEELAYTGSYEYTAGPVHAWRLVRPTRGTMRTQFGRGQDTAPQGQAFAAGPDTEFWGANHSFAATIVTLDLDLVQQVLGPEAEVLDVVGSANSQPLTDAGRDRWDATVGFVVSALASGETADAPLVVSNAKRLLAGTALQLFTSDHTRDRRGSARGAAPQVVRRAAAFAESHADADIGLAEMALAARITPRALQYAFRKHLDTTPEGYLRVARLQHAHADLTAADPQRTTVGEVAARWGFLHQGRFAAYYRDHYGCAPRTTLLG